MEDEMTNSIKLKELHLILKANYRSQWNAEMDVFCKSLLEKLASEYGLVRLEKGIDAMKAKEHFFNEATLRTYVPATEFEPRSCPACRDTWPFVLISVEGEKMPRARRCTHGSNERTVECSDFKSVASGS